MDLAMLQLVGFMDSQTGSVPLSGNIGEPGFFAHTLQSLMGQLPGPGAGETGAPWGRRIDLDSLAASFPRIADALLSGDALFLEAPAALSNSGAAVLDQAEWLTGLGNSGQSDAPATGEADWPPAEEGESAALISRFRFLRDLEGDRPMPLPEAGARGSDARHEGFGEAKVAPQAAGMVFPPAALPQTVRDVLSVGPVEAGAVAQDDPRVPSLNHPRGVSAEAASAAPERQGAPQASVTSPGPIGDRRPSGIEAQASPASGFVESAEGAVQTATAVRQTAGDSSALLQSLKMGAERDPLKEGPVVAAVEPVRGDSGKLASSRDLPAGTTRPDTGETEAVDLKLESQAQGKEQEPQPRDPSPQRAAAAVTPSYGGGTESELPPSSEDAGLTRLDHGVRSVNRVTELPALEGRWPAESVSRPDLWAGRVLGQIESQMQRMVLKGRQKVILQLEPESLGKLKMEVSLSEHGVTAKMTTDSAAAREIIFTHVHALKEALLEQGFRVENLQVHFQEKMGDPGFRDANQPHDHGSGHPLRDEEERRYPSSSESAANPEESDVTLAAGRVNVFA